MSGASRCCTNTNGKDIHHTYCEATENGSGIDDDGVVKLRLSDEVKHNPAELKKAVRELIEQSKNQTTGIRHTKTINTKV